MPNTIGCRFGDVVLVPFPFTDQSSAKRRPAVVISSDAYHLERRDVILTAVTSRARETSRLGDWVVLGWKSAGLLKPSIVKPVLSTVDRELVLRRLGTLREEDRIGVLGVLSQALGG